MTTLIKPVVPGTVIRWAGATTVRISPSASETVAVPLSTDWGPMGADPAGVNGLMGGPQLVSDFQAYTDLYGDSDTEGRTAVAGAFAGSGLPGAPGAGAVLVWRLGATAAAATVTIQTTGGSPASALTLTGYYKGTRGNRISYLLDTDPNNPTVNDRLRILLDGVVREVYVYANTGLTALAAQINTLSKLVTAIAVLPTGRLAAAGAAVALTGGTDGTNVSGDHLAALAGLAYKKFGILSPANLTSSSIRPAYLSWVQSQDAANRPCRLVLGGAAGENVATAITDAATFADHHVLRFGGGTWRDDLLDKDLSTAQLAPRVAGILAAKGQRHSLTSTKVAGLHNVTALPSDQDVAAAVQNGVTVLMPASADDADVRIAKGVSTYIGGDVTRPVQVFGDPRLVGIMDNYVRAMKTWGDDFVVGYLPVNDDTRATVRGSAKRLQDDLLTEGLILPGDDVNIPRPWVNVINTDSDPQNRDAIPYEFGWQFAQTTDAILGSGVIQ